MPANPIYKIKAELMNTNLEIWRQFEVTDNIPMSRFAYIIMSMFNMEGSHLFRFEVPSAENFKICAGECINSKANQDVLEIIEKTNPICYIEVPNPYDDMVSTVKTLDATKIKLKNVLSEVNETMIFNYDFGDDWEIKLTLKEIYTDKAIHGREFPRVITGAGLGIVEDCGGVGGLEDLVTAFEKKSGDEYEQYSEWLEQKGFDINKFDLDFMNYSVKQATAIYKASYEE